MPQSYKSKEYFSQKAKNEGYSARSVYKLQEIHKKYLSIHTCKHILDIGAAPGSWCQYLQKNISKQAQIVAVDIQPLQAPLRSIPKIQFIQGDFTHSNILQQIYRYKPYNLIVSDAVPNTSGIKHLDHARSEEIVLQVITIAQHTLAQHGQLVMKIFQGSELNNIIKILHQQFTSVKQFRPKAVRPQSMEKFIVCR